MSKKHFEAAAAQVREIADVNVRRQVASNFAVVFKVSNPRFDQHRFFQACNV